jgi:hypothetical protein
LEQHADKFIVDKHFRFEGASDPAHEAIIFAILSTKYGVKGILIKGYETFREPLTEELVSALKEKPQ